jgi:DNA primase large subunit
MTLRKNSHLKHFGRLQYTLFLKGIGLTLEDCLIFWRQAFKLITDDTFNKEYRYNVRHVYGDVGGDAIRRGRGYSPFSCQKILTEHPPGSGESHGCPYRHFSVDNLTALLQTTGVNDRDVLRGVKEDVEKKRFHIACNRVFEWAHKGMSIFQRFSPDLSTLLSRKISLATQPVRQSCRALLTPKIAQEKSKKHARRGPSRLLIWTRLYIQTHTSKGPTFSSQAKNPQRLSIKGTRWKCKTHGV